MYFGSQLSIRKGYYEAAKLADSIGAKAFQYFPKNPRSLSIKSFNVHDAVSCAKYSLEKGLLSIAHTPYPTNLAVDEEHKKELMILSLLNDLGIAEACGSIGVVVHFGKYKGDDMLNGYKNIINLINNVTEKWQGNALILIENQASLMGTTLEEMVQIRNLVNNPNKVGFCFDTCHAYASGIWDKSWNMLYKKGMELDYFSNLKAVHLNDSAFPNGSHRDRHANIGEGYLGNKNITDFLSSPVLKEIPVILETPESPQFTHQEEIRMLYTLYVH